MTWKLDDGRLQHAWSAEKVAAERPLVHARMVENLVASVHLTVGEGAAPSVQILDVLTGQGGRVPHWEAMDGEGDALCLCFDGDVIVAGFASGAVVGFVVQDGYAAWKRYHAGAVGCAAVVPAAVDLDGAGAAASRVLTGGAVCDTPPPNDLARTSNVPQAAWMRTPRSPGTPGVPSIDAAY